MSIGNLEEYVDGVRRSYLAAGKKEKGRLLDGVCQTLECHRKAAIRLLRRPLTESAARRRRGRPKVYGVLVAQALHRVWEVSGESCSKRLAPFLAELVGAMERHGELTLTSEVRSALVGLKPTTIDRLLRPYRLLRNRQPSGGSGGALAAIKAQVPVRTFGEWTDVQPGSLQVDLVLHCGESTAGFYLTTLTAVDVASGWTERVAVWGKGQQAVTGALHRVRVGLPVPLREVHSDNGSEFMNGLLQPYCQRAGIRTTRGRPYRKNDQAYVEQKNWTAVREVAGYERYSSRQALKCLGDLYEWERLYRNFFQPVRKLVAKERVGPKVHKHFDVAQTPYQRLLARGVLDEPTQRKLATLYQALAPARLQRHIAGAQHALYAERERRLTRGDSAEAEIQPVQQAVRTT
jgi:hypothetical protein